MQRNKHSKATGARAAKLCSMHPSTFINRAQCSIQISACPMTAQLCCACYDTCAELLQRNAHPHYLPMLMTGLYTTEDRDCQTELNQASVPKWPCSADDDPQHQLQKWPGSSKVQLTTAFGVRHLHSLICASPCDHGGCACLQAFTASAVHKFKVQKQEQHEAAVQQLR